MRLHVLALTCFADNIVVHDDVGRGVFLGIFLSCGAIGSFTSLANSVLRNNLATTALGASGGVLGVLAAWCTLHAK